MPKIDLTLEQCEQVLESQELGYLSMSRDGEPYCLPFNFAYYQGCIYIHTGRKGLKWDFLKENSRVCFAVAASVQKKSGLSPCQYTYEFESVVLFGTASIVDSLEERNKSMSCIIDKYKTAPVTPVPEDKLEKVMILKIEIDKLSGRKNS
ncbi:MAG TPA: pyridoxamine 5'-phosphate oxidase family protein [Desulfobacteria bacterium]|nr:pyridoxamine 5'-phosphate oxidase family protein [Desulfobacteria bacterium]